MGFTEAKTTQIREFTDPKVEKIKEVIKPQISCITARKNKMEKLLRVPKSINLQGLQYESLLGKIASGLEKIEGLIDTYLPPAEGQKKDNDSDCSNASESSCMRINR